MSIKGLGFFFISLLLISMELEVQGSSDSEQPKFWFSVSGLPPPDVACRVRKLMDGLRSEFPGPEIAPHITVVGITSLTEEDALRRFRSAVQGMKVYNAKVERVGTGASYYQCVFLPIDPSPEVVEASAHCSKHFGVNSSTPYMPHMSLIYGDLSDKEKKAAEEKANILDETIDSLSFPITRLELIKIPDLSDKSTKSWQTVAGHDLKCN